MKTIAIIQARYRSTRLQGKVMLDLGNMSALANVIRRLQKCRELDGVVVATRTEPESNIIIQETIKYGAQYFTYQGDVLDRFYKCAKFYGADRIVRITADCPYIMPDLVDRVANCDYEYASNVLERTFPKGLDCEAFSFEMLEGAYYSAKGDEREHVTPYIIKHAERYSVSDYENNSSKRLTLDTEADYRDMTKYYPIIGNVFSYEELRPLLPQLISTEESSINLELGRV